MNLNLALNKFLIQSQECDKIILVRYSHYESAYIHFGKDLAIIGTDLHFNGSLVYELKALNLKNVNTSQLIKQ